MIRFVVGADGMLVPDLGARLPGRGFWLSARADVLDTARGRGAFARAMRAPVNVPPDLPRMIQAGLIRRIGELLGFARRAGQAVAGYTKVRDWLEHGRAGVLVEASDGSLAERSRLLGAAKDLPVIAALAAAELGRIFGRDHVVHAAVARGRLAEALIIEAERLAGMTAAGVMDGRDEQGNGRTGV
jgi:predicted RNA-binding protein YlxR (DUF448 family)